MQISTIRINPNYPKNAVFEKDVKLPTKNIVNISTLLLCYILLNIPEANNVLDANEGEITEDHTGCLLVEATDAFISVYFPSRHPQIFNRLKMTYSEEQLKQMN